MQLLAFEAATEDCSVAFFDSGRIRERNARARAGSAQVLLPMARELLAECGVELRMMDVLAFGRGPGSFTGLRVCAATVQGLAYGAQLPVLPLDVLAVLAQGMLRTAGAAAGERLAPLLDARVGQVYCGLYEAQDGVVRALAEDRLCTPEQALAFLEEAGGPWRAVGADWHTVPGLAAHPGRDAVPLFPRASDTATLAAHALRRGTRPVAPEQALPLYLRGAGAWEKRAGSEAG